MARLKTELNCKNELIEYQECRPAETVDNMHSLNLTDELVDKSDGGGKAKVNTY